MENNLIEELNPEWRDLYEEFVLNQDLLDASDKPRHVGGGTIVNTS